MKKRTLLTLSLLLTGSLLQGALGVNDNQYIKAYNNETTALSKNFGSMRTKADYQNSQKSAKVEENLKNIEAIIKKFSDQNDHQVIKMKRQLKKNQKAFYKNLKLASGSTTKPAQSSKKPVSPLTKLKTSFYTEFTSAVKALNEMNTREALGNVKKQEALKTFDSSMQAKLEEIKKLNNITHRKYYNRYAKWRAEYYKRAQSFTGINAPKKAPTPEKLTSADRKNLKKFRNAFISNDWMFRSIDSVKLQDPKYRKKFEDALTLLQSLLNPMRTKTFDRGVKRADSDLSVIENNYKKALGISEQQANNAGDVDKQLLIVQQQFDQSSYDPRLQMKFEVIKNPMLVAQWASKMKRDEAMIPDILAFIQKAQANSLKARSDEFRSYAHWFKNSVQDKLTYAKQQELDIWNPKIREGVPSVNRKEASLKRELEDQDAVKDLIESYKLGKQSLENKMAFEKAYYGNYSKESLAMNERYIAFNARLASSMQESIKNQKLPKAVSIDPALMETVKKLLPSMRKFGKISNMQAVTDVSVRKELLFANDAWHTEVTKYYTVRFVEKENDRYFIKYAGLRFDQELFYGYINGKRKWYIVNLTGPMQGDEILESNLK